MNIYHITYGLQAGVVHLHFWGCNLACRACLLKKELYDCHLAETKDNIFNPKNGGLQEPECFLDLDEVVRILREFKVREVIFMGAEPTVDPELPQLAKELHKKYSSHNILLTNGFLFADLADLDEVVVSIKAYTSELHRHYTGKSNRNVLRNFVRYYHSGVGLRAESVFISDYIDCPEIERVSMFIAGVNRSIPYRIDGYIPISGNPWRRPSVGEMGRAVSTARKHLDKVSCLTGNEELKFEVVRII